MDGSIYAIQQGCTYDGVFVLSVPPWLSLSSVDANDYESIAHEGSWPRMGAKVYATYGRSPSWWSGPHW